MSLNLTENLLTLLSYSKLVLFNENMLTKYGGMVKYKQTMYYLILSRVFADFAKSGCKFWPNQLHSSWFNFTKLLPKWKRVLAFLALCANFLPIFITGQFVRSLYSNIFDWFSDLGDRDTGRTL